MAAAGPPAAAVAAPGAIARLVAGGVAPPMPGPAPNLNVVTGDLTDLMPPASGAMVDSTLTIYYHEPVAAASNRRQRAVDAALAAERANRPAAEQMQAAADVLAGRDPPAVTPPPWVAPTIAAYDETQPVGQRITIEYGSVEDPVERVRARERLYNVVLGTDLTPNPGNDGAINDQNTVLNRRKTLIREDMSSKAYYESVESAYAEREKSLRMKALYDAASTELGTASTGELVPPPSVVAVPYQRAHNFPDDKLLKGIVSRMKDAMSVTLDGPLDYMAWFQRLQRLISSAVVSDMGALTVIAKVVVGSLSYIVEAEIAKPNPSLETCWWELQREVAIARQPSQLQSELVQLCSKKPLCPAMVFRNLQTIVRLLYSGPNPTDTMQVINTTRQMWISILTRFYPIYASQIMKKDAASRTLLAQAVEEAKGGPLPPRIISAYDPIESLYRASRDAIPRWNDNGEEERARSKDRAAQTAALSGSAQSKVDVRVVQDDGNVAVVSMDADVAAGMGLSGSALPGAQVAAASKEDDDGSKARDKDSLQPKNRTDQQWEQMTRMTSRDVADNQPKAKTRGRRRYGGETARVNEVAEVLTQLMNRRGHVDDGALLDAAIMTLEGVAPKEDESPQGIPSQGMNAASAFARNLDNVMRPFGGGRPPPGGGGQGPPPFRRSEVCFSCNRDGSHRWRACPLYPEMANAVSLNSSHCGSCGGRHHGPCRSHQ